MEPWKPVLLIVPAGLLLGTLGGHATRPVPLMKDERPWPASVREKASATQPWRPIHEAGPQNLSLGRYSYRPNFDYDVFVWPDQRDRSAALLVEDYSYRAPLEARYALTEPDLPQTRRAEAEIAAERVRAAGASGPSQLEDSLPSEGEIFVLPPVPPLFDLEDTAVPEEPAEEL